MENFVINNPTILHFGRGATEEVGRTVALSGSKVLLLYGKGSIKKNGIYLQIIEQLDSCGCEVTEYSGIKPNPVISDVDAAAALGRKNKVDVILAVGGGSVIDSAKFIALAIPLSCPAWDILEYKAKPAKALPIIAVLTLAATGTEMNAFAVVQNDETKQKPGYFSPLIYPKHSFLDPANTLSVPADQTAYGIVDLIAHCLEAYFGKGDTTLSDRFTLSIIREAIEYGPDLIKNLCDYRLREKIMYAATCALNGLTFYGKPGGDWAVHGIGHSLSVLYDVPHGASLSIAYPAWLKHFRQTAEDKILLMGKELFGASTTTETIEMLEQFFSSIGSPIRLSEMNIGLEKKEEILQNIAVNKVDGGNYRLKQEDFSAIFDLAL